MTGNVPSSGRGQPRHFRVRLQNDVSTGDTSLRRSSRNGLIEGEVQVGAVAERALMKPVLNLERRYPLEFGYVVGHAYRLDRTGLRRDQHVVRPD